MKNKKRFTIIILSSLLLVLQLIVAVGYGYFDMTTQSNDETIKTGVWIWDNPSLEHSFAMDYHNKIQEYIEYGYWDYQEIYSQEANYWYYSKNVDNVEIYNYDWDIVSYSYSYYYPTVGYISLIDRSLDSNGNYIYDINPTYPEVNDYTYFVANDVMNSYTHNTYSLRLNYYTMMTTAIPIKDFESISFYARMGLSDSDDSLSMRDNTTLYVQMSNNGYSWKTVGRINPKTSNNEVEDFDYYSYEVPYSLKKYDDIYIRIYYVGYPSYVLNRSWNYELMYGRVVLDDLKINVK